jgi:hypothetical protein
LQVKQVRKHQACWPSAYDSDLRSHRYEYRQVPVKADTDAVLTVHSPLARMNDKGSSCNSSILSHYEKKPVTG